MEERDSSLPHQADCPTLRSHRTRAISRGARESEVRPVFAVTGMIAHRRHRETTRCLVFEASLRSIAFRCFRWSICFHSIVHRQSLCEYSGRLRGIFWNTFPSIWSIVRNDYNMLVHRLVISHPDRAFICTHSVLETSMRSLPIPERIEEGDSRMSWRSAMLSIDS
jgi:hypothetical protein